MRRGTIRKAGGYWKGAEKIDDELMGWVKEAAVFSDGKR